MFNLRCLLLYLMQKIGHNHFFAYIAANSDMYLQNGWKYTLVILPADKKSLSTYKTTVNYYKLCYPHIDCDACMGDWASCILSVLAELLVTKENNGCSVHKIKWKQSKASRCTINARICSYISKKWLWPLDMIEQCLCPRQYSVDYMGDSFYRSKDPTNSIKVLKEMLQRTNQTTKTTKYTYAQTIIDTKKDIHKISTTSPLVYTNMRWLGDGSHSSPGLNGSGTAAAVPPDDCG